jgi:DNA (cytosine-5)-methyltransferase 3A
MNVLSLFDGMSCGQQALERAGIKVENYFASEIDKYAITVAMANYPNTKQLGSVVDLNGFDLPKIDLLIGGSPCQSFSFAGKRKGMATKDEQEILTLEHYLQLKAEGFEFEGQSYLFWEFMRLLNETKPKYFLLENVKMSKKWKDILSKAIGVEPILINSNLLSAQNRQRLYWTNIPNIEQPKDKGILLKDIIEQEVDSKYFLSEKSMAWLNNRIEEKHKFIPRIPNSIEKSNCLKVGGKGVDDLIVHNMMPRSSTNGNGGSGHLCRTDGKTYCLDTGRTNAIEIIATQIGNSVQFGNSINDKGKAFTLRKGNPNGLIIKTTLIDDEIVGCGIRGRDNGEGIYKSNLEFRNDDKSNTLLLNTNTSLAKVNSRVRRLTPIECERLQTVKDNYTNYVSDTQRYRMLGNGWTVDVISHIFKYII